MISHNITIQSGVLPSLLQELETLGISINHLDYLNDSGELDNLADNLKQQFMEEIREMKNKDFSLTPVAVNLTVSPTNQLARSQYYPNLSERIGGDCTREVRNWGTSCILEELLRESIRAPLYEVLKKRLAR